MKRHFHRGHVKWIEFEVPIAQAVLKICLTLIVCQKFRRNVTSHAPFGESYLCIQSAFYMRSYWPNL